MSSSPPRDNARTVLEQAGLELTDIYTTAPIGLCLLDTDTRYLRVNQHFAAISGYSIDEHIGKRVRDLVPDRAGVIEELTRKVVETGEPLLDIEIQGETPAQPGVIRYWKENWWPIKETQGRVIAINIVVVEEITERKRAENALRESEEWFRGMAERSSDLVLILDERMSPTYVSPSARIIIGYEPGELVGKSSDFALSTIFSDCGPEFMKGMEETLNGRSIEKFELRLRKKDGNTVYVSTNAVPVVREGVFTGAQVSMRDITATKEAEIALRESEEKFRTLAETAAPAILVYQDDRFVYVNPLVERITGYSMDELFAMQFWELLHPEDQPMIRERAKARLRGEVVPSRYEARYRTKGGQIGILEINASVMNYNGRPAGLITALDITERKLAERALRESQRKYQALIETNVDFVWEMDARGRYTYCSPQMETLWGLKPEEMIGKTPFDVMPSDARERAVEEFARMADSPRRFNGFVTIAYDGHGKVIFVEISGVPFFDDNGALLGYRGVSRDITERKRTEEALRKIYEELEWRVEERTAELAAANKELESFTYSISHDLRAPLRAIDGYSHILLVEHAPSLTPDARQFLEKVRTNVQSMSRLIDDLLHFSRTGRQPLAKVAINPSELVGNTLEGLQFEQEGRSVEIVMGDLPSCQADPTMLRQVFHNLLSNALKFSRTCEKARIEIGSCQKDGTTVYYIRDNGIGFDMAYARKIFGVFQRFHRQQEYEGTGVGLAIVKRIIDRHGGRIWAKSVPGTGSTFYFTIPAMQALLSPRSDQQG